MNVNNIKELIDLTFSIKSNAHIKYSVSKISTSISESVKNVTGLSVTNYTHIIDNFAVKHTILKHGNSIKENSRGQIAVTIDYFNKIPDVLKKPDKIFDGGINNIGRRVIIFSRRFNGNIIYIEEVRTKRKELSMQTMYIKKAR